MARVWQKKGEGLMLTSKGSNDLAGGRRVHVMVAIAYRKGVILAEPYKNGNFFAQFIKNKFNICFLKSCPKHDGKTYIRHGQQSVTKQQSGNECTL